MSAHPLLPPGPTATRLRRPGWRDTRFLLGIGLVAASVALGATAVTAAARTVPVYAAAEALVPGDAITSDALVVRDVRLAESQGAYLRADRPLPDGLVAVRVVDDGELVPVAAVAASADLGLRPVAITPDGALSDDVVAGATVDLWFVPAEETDGADGADGSAAPPRELAADLTVAEVTEEGSGFAAGSDATVQVLVPVDDLPDVLGALAADGSVALVPVPGPTR